MRAKRPWNVPSTRAWATTLRVLSLALVVGIAWMVVQRMAIMVLATSAVLVLLLTVSAVRSLRAELHRVRHREQRLRAVLDTAADGIIAFDERRRVQSVNPAARALFGVAPDDIIDRSLDDFIKSSEGAFFDPDCPDFDASRGTMRRCAATGYRKDGTHIELELGLGDSVVEGRRLFVGTFRDASAQGHHEEQRRKSQQLEVVAQLAASAAHDFNNLLMGVSGCADAAISRLEDTSGARSYVEHICNAAKSGAALSQRLSVLARRSDSVGSLVGHEGSVASACEGDPERIDRRAGTVLLVEDDPLVRMTVHGYLQEAGFRVLEAGNGEEAERIASYESLDLLVSDIVLFDLSGAELAQQLAIRHPTLPSVLMSAHPAEYLQETGCIRPGTAILQKPFTRRQLWDAIPPDTSPRPELIDLGDIAPLDEELGPP